MPVLLQTLQQTSDPALLEQLNKIYQDAEPERLKLPGQTQGQPVDKFIQDVLNDDQRTFYCALFNERLIGALVTEQESETLWAISHLCVRKVTRRRGVGSRLLALTLMAAKEAGVTISAPAHALMTPDHIILQRMGYQLTEQGDHYLLNPAR